MKVSPRLSADAVLELPTVQDSIPTTDRILVVGASTGGTEALSRLLEAMPAYCPPIVIVQHMPMPFTTAFAERLDSVCAITVKEARNYDTLHNGLALLAPGDKHMLLFRKGLEYSVRVQDGPFVSRHKPSVDVLFRSAAIHAGNNAVGIIMTGMGDDGAACMKEMKDAGAYNIAQDEQTCVVFGMPNEAILRGAVDVVLGLDEISQAALNACARRRNT